MFAAWSELTHGEVRAFARPGGDSATVLEGDWIRVVDGCADLPLNQVLALPESGGGNGVSRSETLSFRGANYRMQNSPSPRCAADYKASGPELQTADYGCDEGLSTGSVNLEGPHRFTLTVRERSGDNAWGEKFRAFEFEIYRDQILFLHSGEPDYACSDGNKRIYFLRAPSS